jgi:hypothetical protein
MHAGIMVALAKSGSRQATKPRFATATVQVAGRAGFLLIINGFVEILGRHPGFIRNENNRPKR